MPDPLAQAQASRYAKRPAVRFGEIRRYDRMRAYPFFYNFISDPYQQGQVDSATGIYQVSVADAQGPDGLLIAASSGVLEIPIVMDRDTIFHLLSIRYGAWNPSLSPPNTGSRAALLQPADALQGGNSYFQAQMNQFDYYVSYLDVSVYMVSSGARDLMGGMQRDAITGAREEIPVPAQATQGTQDGAGSLRTAFQLPKEASVRIRIVNRYPAALRVYGHLFGYKVTV